MAESKSKWIKTRDSITPKKHKRANTPINHPITMITEPLQNLLEHTTTPAPLGQPLNDNIVEGFDIKNPCQSIGELFSPLLKYKDYIIYWGIDKSLIEYPTVLINYTGHLVSNIGTNFNQEPDQIVVDELESAFKEMNKVYTDNDTVLITNQIKYFLAILISCYIVYNWYYLMFYKELGYRVDVLDISTDNLINYNNLLGFIFKYLIVPLSLVNSIVIKKIPALMWILNPNMQFLILFLIIISIVINHGASYMQSFSTYLKMKTDSNAGIMTTIMILFGVFSIFRVRFSMNYLNELFRYFTQMVTAQFFIPLIVMFAIRISLSISVVWFAGLLVFGYIIGLSFLAIPVYSSYSIVETIKQINEYVYKPKLVSSCPVSKCDPTVYSKCNPMTFGDMIHDLIAWITDKIHTNLFEVVFIVFFFQGFMSYSVNIQNLQLKTVMLVLTSLCIFIMCFICYYRKLKQAELDAKELLRLIELNKTNPEDCSFKPKGIVGFIYNTISGFFKDEPDEIVDASNNGVLSNLFSSISGLITGTGLTVNTVTGPSANTVTSPSANTVASTNTVANTVTSPTVNTVAGPTNNQKML